MIDAAEAIVAERGLAAMSLREVQSRAGQLNKNAAQYHFGDRTGLVAAVVEARMAPINEERWRLLAQLDRGSAVSVRQLVEVLIYPLVQAVSTHPGSRYARFLAQAAFDPQLSAMIMEHVRADSAREVLSRLVGSARLPAGLEAARLQSMFVTVIVTLAQWESSSELQPDPALAIDLVDTATAALLAPSSHPSASGMSGRLR